MPGNDDFHSTIVISAARMGRRPCAFLIVVVIVFMLSSPPCVAASVRANVWFFGRADSGKGGRCLYQLVGDQPLGNQAPRRGMNLHIEIDHTLDAPQDPGS